MAGMAIPYEKPYEQKIFLAVRIGGGENEVPTECGEIPMVSELEGGVNRSATTLVTAENGRPRADGRKTHENGFQTAPPGSRVRWHRAVLPTHFQPKLYWNARIRILAPWLPP